jgi:hypothetical protein
MNKSRLFLIISLSFVFLIFGGQVSATTILSPIINIETEPGQTQRGVIKVYNESDSDIYLVSSLEAFLADDEFGIPKFYQPAEDNNFLSWIKLDAKDIVLKPKQVGIIPFDVNVPIEAIPGGYYAAIFWQQIAQSTGETSPVGISGRVGALVFITVGGDLIAKGELTDFYLAGEKNIATGLPLNYVARFANQGNVHQAPSGEITMENIFGVKHVIQFNQEQRVVLPNSSRQFEVNWPSQNIQKTKFLEFINQAWQEIKLLSFGPHTASLKLNHGFGNVEIAESQINFWIIPVKSISLLIGTLIFLFLIFKLRAFAYQKKSLPKNNEAVDKN